MRKWVLLAAGIMISGVLFFDLCRSGAAQYRRAGAATVPEETQVEEKLSLPYAVAGTQLLAVGLAEYEGPFWEDGSGEEAAGICALIIENTGGIMAFRGAVTLDAGDRQLVFEFTCLPPGGRVLVPERSREPFESLSLRACSGWSVGIYPENSGAVTAQELEHGSLALTNHTTQPIAGVTVLYKSYDPESGMYIGGISHSLSRENLLPGEICWVNAPNYAGGYSKVVCVLPSSEP